MLASKYHHFKTKISNDFLFHFLLLFCVLLPFQFALNPLQNFDLAVVRVVIPLMFFWWLFLAIRRKETILQNNKISYLFLTFLTLATLSLFFSHNIFWSLRKLLFLFSIVPVYFVVLSALKTPSRRRKIIVALVGGATLLSIISILQFSAQFVFGIDPVYNFLAHSIAPFFLGRSFSQAVLAYPSWLVNAGGATYMRATSIFPDPHMLSYYLGMLIPFSIALWSTSKKHAGLFFFSSALLIVADICTFTRGGYIALIAGMVVILPLVSKQAIKKLLLAAATLAFLFTLAPHSPVAGRLTSSFDLNEGSNQGRISNWQQAFLIIKNHPLGVGIGMYSLAVDPNADYREPIYAHDLYLDIAAELGIQTAFVFVAILFLAFIYFWKAAKNDPLLVAGVSSLIIFSTHSLVETPLYSVHVLTLVCILIALSASIKQYEKN
ncbi:MAG: O-antigen ligase family protein [Candidatus Moranbacteria bacterium]|nr:O-antigen ligase family protein [Candidatus Moranbacteria bacterium]